MAQTPSIELIQSVAGRDIETPTSPLPESTDDTNMAAMGEREGISSVECSTDPMCTSSENINETGANSLERIPESPEGNFAGQADLSASLNVNLTQQEQENEGGSQPQKVENGAEISPENALQRGNDSNFNPPESTGREALENMDVQNSQEEIPHDIMIQGSNMQQATNPLNGSAEVINSSQSNENSTAPPGGDPRETELLPLAIPAATESSGEAAQMPSSTGTEEVSIQASQEATQGMTPPVGHISTDTGEIPVGSEANRSTLTHTMSQGGFSSPSHMLDDMNPPSNPHSNPSGIQTESQQLPLQHMQELMAVLDNHLSPTSDNNVPKETSLTPSSHLEAVQEYGDSQSTPEKNNQQVDPKTQSVSTAQHASSCCDGEGNTLSDTFLNLWQSYRTCPNGGSPLGLRCSVAIGDCLQVTDLDDRFYTSILNSLLTNQCTAINDVRTQVLVMFQLFSAKHEILQ